MTPDSGDRLPERPSPPVTALAPLPRATRDARDAMIQPLRTARRAASWLRWYLREVTGESAYERYLAHVLADHPDAAILTRRQFERQRTDTRDARPTTRCC